MSAHRGRLAAYAAYQFKDYMVERGLPVLLIGVLIGWTTLLATRAQFGRDWTDLPNAAVASVDIMRGTLTQFAFLSTLLSVAGVVANDRRHGYFRLLFAQPVSAVRYYLQAFLAALVGLMLVIALLHGLWALVAPSVAPWGMMRALSFYYLVVGGTAFLMSAILRWDWVATTIVWAGSGILREIYARDTGLVAWMVKHLTAPTHIIDALRDELYRGRMPDTDQLLWALTYAFVCIAGALIIIRLRPMAQ